GDYGAAFGHDTIAGDNGFAAGYGNVGGPGSFIYSDPGPTFDRSAITNGFSVRASGGTYFETPTFEVTGRFTGDAVGGDASRLPNVAGNAGLSDGELIAWKELPGQADHGLYSVAWNEIAGRSGLGPTNDVTFARVTAEGITSTAANTNTAATVWRSSGNETKASIDNETGAVVVRGQDSDERYLGTWRSTRVTTAFNLASGLSNVGTLFGDVPNAWNRVRGVRLLASFETNDTVTASYATNLQIRVAHGFVGGGTVGSGADVYKTISTNVASAKSAASERVGVYLENSNINVQRAVYQDYWLPMIGIRNNGTEELTNVTYTISAEFVPGT
ncbi:MAG: hypothetical protein KBC05_14945, partial [Candidatus Hydrogenedentes bacterium]|nr:hypothetical protein [Candidatus Hydrogenedentota bacterium]